MSKPESTVEGCSGVDWCERHQINHGHPEPPDPSTKLVREFVELTPVATQIIRIREQFKTFKENFGVFDLNTNVPDLQGNFVEAFKAIADNLDVMINYWTE